VTSAAGADVGSFAARLRDVLVDARSAAAQNVSTVSGAVASRLRRNVLVIDVLEIVVSEIVVSEIVVSEIVVSEIVMA
jgi:hypothetical protein